ncbi:hypothetical protein [Hyphomicrobium sp. 802]|uniref:hypothetical protein n=1 Tax=Hyphomicrobium sp. 802 TaxID=1112272 RepID=UPI00045EAB63|nr:hypothetical protein [Hyphomicrobium sp. 802]
MPDQPHWSLSDDKTTLVLDLPTTPSARMELDADEVDNLIAALADLRSRMTPSVPMADPDAGFRLPVASGGRWYVAPNGAQGAMLFLLHPGHRWVGLMLDPESMRQLIQTLLRFLPLSPQSG